ncbi:YggS family pyridoxal phosphate-dependent enzyme [Marinomonas sp.]
MITESQQVADNLVDVVAKISEYEQAFARPQGAVKLLAVSKTKPVSALQAAYDAGQRLFGENYVQEMVEKRQILEQLSDIEWHFIGPIQSNKTRQIAEHADWVHTIDREKVARRLSEQRPSHLDSLNVCIQINISGEESKAGIAFSELDDMVELINSLPGLTLRGLMAIPAPCSDQQAQQKVYAPLQQAFLELKEGDNMIDTLSIGMTGDMPAAIASGSTMIRIGTAIFGARDYASR